MENSIARIPVSKRYKIMLKISGTSCEVVYRHCGGWLAHSSRGQSLRIGVTARTEGEAVERYQVAVAEWLRNIAAGARCGSRG